MRHIAFLALVYSFAVVNAPSDARAAEQESAEQESAEQESAEQRRFFETKIRPILAERCYGCHSTRVKMPKGGLRLDRRETILEGGDSGPAVMPGDADASLIPGRTGDFWWAGYFGTQFFVSPETGLVGVLLSQNEPGPYDDGPVSVYIAQALAFAGL